MHTATALLSWQYCNYCSILCMLHLFVIVHYVEEQCIIIVKTCYKCGEHYAQTDNKLQRFFGQQNAPNQSSVKRLLRKNLREYVQHASSS